MDTKLDQETFAAHVSTPSVTKEVYILTPPSSGRTGRVTNFHNIHDLATPSNRTPLPSVLHYSPISEDEGNSSNIGYESCVGTDHSFHGGNNLFSSPVLQKSESEGQFFILYIIKFYFKIIDLILNFNHNQVYQKLISLNTGSVKVE